MIGVTWMVRHVTRAAALIACWMGFSMAVIPPEGQAGGSSDSVTIARLRAGEIAREITASRRDPSHPEPSQLEVFNTGLLLQAGLRALLPVNARQGVALPGVPSPHDPKLLVDAQENYKAVFKSGEDATATQRALALDAIRNAVHQLSNWGYTEFSMMVSGWLNTQ